MPSADVGRQLWVGTRILDGNQHLVPLTGGSGSSPFKTTYATLHLVTENDDSISLDPRSDISCKRLD